MRLADQIVAASLNGNPLAADFGSFAAALRDAERYDIDEAGAKVAHFIGTSSLSHIIEKRRTARLPHPTCWIEWLGPSAGYNRAPVPPTAETVRPLRCGVLIEMDETGLRGRLTWAWSLPEIGPSLCPFAMLFDWTDHPGDVPDLIRAACSQQGVSWEDLAKPGLTAVGPVFSHGFDREAFLAEERRWGMVVSQHSKVMLHALDTLAKTDAASAIRAAALARNDVRGEPAFVLGLIISMSDPSLLHITLGEDLSRLNKARAKQGRPALLSFSRIGRPGMPMRAA